MVAEINPQITSLGELPFYEPTLVGPTHHIDRGTLTEPTTRVLYHPQDSSLRIIEVVDVCGRIIHATECRPEHVSEFFSS